MPLGAPFIETTRRKSSFLSSFSKAAGLSTAGSTAEMLGAKRTGGANALANMSSSATTAAAATAVDVSFLPFSLSLRFFKLLFCAPPGLSLLAPIDLAECPRRATFTKPARFDMLDGVLPA
uniref:Uncharacterized protein n=1 Tax=Coccolithus braarudii TaxID=221442 RepID=A0A7S0QB33_9EUKA|mmetsp:Transcript_6365/g.13889  ORF Transcript_6365/g.13889 Transcript_6365/m.13889 type:complete len:121 (+) Transcript_6365:493-855(+)